MIIRLTRFMISQAPLEPNLKDGLSVTEIGTLLGQAISKIRSSELFDIYPELIQHTGVHRCISIAIRGTKVHASLIDLPGHVLQKFVSWHPDEQDFVDSPYLGVVSSPEYDLCDSTERELAFRMIADILIDIDARLEELELRISEAKR